jgi:hypothetical protein
VSPALDSVPISKELFRDVAQQASRDGVALEEWVSNALAERVRVERQSEEFFRRRAAGASSLTLGALLDKASSRDPDPGDELQ